MLDWSHRYLGGGNGALLIKVALNKILLKSLFITIFALNLQSSQALGVEPMFPISKLLKSQEDKPLPDVLKTLREELELHQKQDKTVKKVRYYFVLFGYEGRGNPASESHTFAAFVKVSNQSSTKSNYQPTMFL